MSKSPKKWYDAYRGQDEYNFFIAIARHKEYKWRTIAAIAKEANLTELRVEEILDKYSKYDPPLVHPNPSGDHQWGYWERVKDYIPAKKKSIAGADHENRMSKSSYSSSDGYDSTLYAMLDEWDRKSPSKDSSAFKQSTFAFMKADPCLDVKDATKTTMQLISSDNTILATYDICISTIAVKADDAVPIIEVKMGDTIKCSAKINFT